MSSDITGSFSEAVWAELFIKEKIVAGKEKKGNENHNEIKKIKITIEKRRRKP